MITGVALFYSRFYLHSRFYLLSGVAGNQAN